MTIYPSFVIQCSCAVCVAWEEADAICYSIVSLLLLFSQTQFEGFFCTPFKCYLAKSITTATRAQQFAKYSLKMGNKRNHENGTIAITRRLSLVGIFCANIAYKSYLVVNRVIGAHLSYLFDVEIDAYISISNNLNLIVVG